MIKKFFKKVFKGFSLIEVIIAVNLLALILAILGLSALGSQKLFLNAQIKSAISKIGEGVLDYICSLPPTDSHVDPTIAQNNQNNQNNIVSLADFAGNIITDQNIINNANNILSSGVSTFRVGIANNVNVNGNFTHKGRVIQFGNNRNNNSFIEVRDLNMIIIIIIIIIII